MIDSRHGHIRGGEGGIGCKIVKFLQFDKTLQKKIPKPPLKFSVHTKKFEPPQKISRPL